MDDVLKPDTIAALKALPKKRAGFALAYGTWNGSTFRNVTQSALAAGYAPNTAAKVSHRLLDDHGVKKAILLVERDTRTAQLDVTLVDAAWLHRHLSVLAHASILDFGDVVRGRDGRGQWMLDLCKIAEKPELARAIESVKTTSDRAGTVTQEIKLMRRRDVLDLLGKHVDVQAFREAIHVEEVEDRKAAILEARQRTRLRVVRGDDEGGE